MRGEVKILDYPTVRAGVESAIAENQRRARMYAAILSFLRAYNAAPKRPTKKLADDLKAKLVNEGFTDAYVQWVSEPYWSGGRRYKLKVANVVEPRESARNWVDVDYEFLPGADGKVPEETAQRALDENFGIAVNLESRLPTLAADVAEYNSALRRIVQISERVGGVVSRTKSGEAFRTGLYPLSTDFAFYLFDGIK